MSSEFHVKNKGIFMILKTRFIMLLILHLCVLLSGCGSENKTKITQKIIFMKREARISMIKAILDNKKISINEHSENLKKRKIIPHDLFYNPHINYWNEFFFFKNELYEDYINMYCAFPYHSKKYKYIAITFGGVKRFFRNPPNFDKKYPDYPIGDE